ncbi:MAG: MATE family efflux transporter [Myxococcota bacterium]|nr:MATE family efflux transporter [Myxococcota bacterium]MDW8361496.1 MATE family efflux transporter [Myxococcales bacterium]
MRRTLAALLPLAWPIVVSRATQTVVGLADATMVAHLGEGALAAVSAGATNAYLVMVLPMGTVSIVQSFAAQFWGAGDAMGARRAAVYGLLIALGSALLAASLWPAVPALLALLPYEPVVAATMSDYIQLRLLATGPAVGLEALAAYYGGVGRTRVPMVASVVAMTLNVGLNALLIDGRLGLPALGVRGAAVASVLATTVAFVGLLAYLRRDGALPRPGFAEGVRVLRFGLPAGLNWFGEFAAWVAYLDVVVASAGTTVLAAMMAVVQLNGVSFMPAFGLASAGAILVGQAIGAAQRDRVPALVRATLGAAAAWQCSVGLAYVLVPDLLFAPFARGAAEQAPLAVLGARMLALSAAWQAFDAACMTYAESLRAAGDTFWPMVLRFVIGWLFALPLGWIWVNRLDGGADAAVLGAVAWTVLLAVALWLRFRSGRWRHIELTGPERLPEASA